MIVQVTRVEKDKSFFDKSVKFQGTKAAYVNYALPVGSVYQVEEVEQGLYSMPRHRNKVR